MSQTNIDYNAALRRLVQGNLWLRRAGWTRGDCLRIRLYADDSAKIRRFSSDKNVYSPLDQSDYDATDYIDPGA